MGTEDPLVISSLLGDTSAQEGQKKNDSPQDLSGKLLLDVSKRLHITPSDKDSSPHRLSPSQDVTSQILMSEASHTLSCEIGDDPTINSKTEDTAYRAEDDPNSDGSDDDVSQDHDENKPRNLTAKRVADQDEFTQWIRQEQKRINEKSMGLPCESSSMAGWDDADVKRIISSCHPADKRIISSPREYQVELFERAKEKNLIVVLPTGTGKTLIAALLVRHIVEQELVDRSSKAENLEPRISFFLVDKISLVHQQWKVLRANLAHNVAKFHGDLLGSALTHQFWKQQFEENMVIVCTAEILRQCLSHGYFRMGQINLIIFDEAHHAKKNHPYARIIKDFYADLEKNGWRRPRILGMTASPVDAKTDLATGAAQLEGLLHAEIATVDDPALVRTVSSKDVAAFDHIIDYRLSDEDFETPLWGILHKLLGHNAVFRKIFIYSRACTRQLGRWCADRVWHLCLTPHEMSKAKARTEMILMKSQHETLVSSIDVQVGLVEEANQLLQETELPEVEPSNHHLSHKVLALLEILKQHFQPNIDKCIIFVEQRLTAILLADLFHQPGLKACGITAGTLLGSGMGEIGALQSMSNYEQQRAIQQFHTGDLNVLITTTIGEEGLDIPDCNMVIRFDLYQTMIQYIQSKGRARMMDSKYFHMVESGNAENVQRVYESQGKEEALRDFCLALPEDRLLRGNDFNMEYFLRKEKTKRVYKVPSTGAKLTYESSLVVLATYVATLSDHADVDLRADYIVKSAGKEFQCEVIMPDNSPAKSALGRRAGSKQIAKCSAAFEMCLKLRKSGELDEHLQSTRKKRLPAMRNAQLALSSKKRAEYSMRTKPDIWDHRGIPSILYITVLKLESPEALGRPSRPLALLTRSQLPSLAKFPLFFGNQQTSIIDCVPFSSGISVCLEQVKGLTEFTLRVFKDVFSKEYKSEPEKLPYFLAPSAKDHAYPFSSHGGIDTFIDWNCITMLQSTGDLEWEGQPPAFFENKYITDPYDGSRKFYTMKHRGDLKPTDLQIPNVKGLGNQRSRREAPNDIWNYSVSLWSKSRSRIEVRNDLAVFEAEYIPLRRNLLDEYEKSDSESNRCYICFATLRISSLPVDAVAMASNLPAIIHRLESNLIVLEAVHGLDLDIRPDLALEAMTKDSDNTDEHSAEQVNFQRGMGNNYERLEFLGDSFLKMSTSIALYTEAAPRDSEFNHHVDRMILICNKNLFNNALDLKLEESIRSKSFNRRVWYPEGLEQLSGKMNTSIKGKKGTGRSIHVLGDKSIADVCEALIGAAYLTGKESNSFDLAVKAVTTFSNSKLENKFHKMKAYDEFYAAFKVPAWQSAEPTAVHVDLARKIEVKLGYKFTHPRLLRCAFMHASYGFSYEHIPSYQRLEFLGDALLDMVCVDYLFHRFPGADPQWLTEHKMAMVSNQFLGSLCVSLDLHRHLVSLAPDMPQQIAAYVDSITFAREQAEEDAVKASGSRSSYSRSYWTTIKAVPKCLPDIIEAYIGAIFVDSKYNYGEVQSFFKHHIMPYFEDMHLYDTFANKHPVTFLSNTLHQDYSCADWRVMVSELPPDGSGSMSDTKVVGVVMIHGAVRAHATSASGRYAKIAAAGRCISLLKDMTIDEYKKTFGCDCKPEDVAESETSKHATAV
ncbi:RNase3 domain protein [Seiridium cupressi]